MFSFIIFFCHVQTQIGEEQFHFIPFCYFLFYYGIHSIRRNEIAFTMKYSMKSEELSLKSFIVDVEFLNLKKINME